MSLRNESAFWNKLREQVKKRGGILKKIPAEGFAGKGLPDGLFAISGGMGVVELKYLRSWPARPTTPVQLALTPNQWNWLEDWTRKGKGRGFILFGIEDDWFLLQVAELAFWGAPAERGFTIAQSWLREAATYKGRLDDLDPAVDVLAFAPVGA